MVEITRQNAREAAAAAQRLLHDPFLNEALDEMIQLETEKAITGATREERRDGRYLALAIIRLRANLRTVVESWEPAAQLAERVRARE